MRIFFLCFFFLLIAKIGSAGHQLCATAKVVCDITDQPNETPLCNGSCSGNNNLVNATNSCFTGGLTRWGFYMFTIQQSGTLTFTIAPDAPGVFDCGNYNFALFDVTNGCGNLGNAIRCSISDDGCTGSNTGLNMTATDTSEGTGGDGWVKYIDAQCGHTYVLCLDIPGNDGNGLSLSFGGTCLFGVSANFTASTDTACVGQPVTFMPDCNVANSFITYSWNFGPNATPSTYTGLIPPPVTFSTIGTQNVTLTATFTAGSSCVNSSSQNIFVTNGAPTSSFTVSSPVCFGTNTTITYSGSASIGALYNWNFGSGSIVSGSGQGPYQISWATPGTYSVTLDVTECVLTSPVTTMTVTVFPSPTANAGPDVNICSGFNATLNASGGSSYLWSPAAGLSNSNISNPVANPTSATTYTVIVSNGNCASIDSMNVNVNPVPVAAIASQTDVSCFGSSTGSAVLSVSSGTNPISYFWTPTSQTTQSATGLSAGVYTVVITDVNGCLTNISVSITQPTALTATSTVTPVSCYGGANGTATVIAAGGTPNYTYLWMPGGGITSSINGLTMGGYTVLVTDGNGCTTMSAITITQPAAVSLNLASVSAGCGMNNGTASATMNGGTMPYTYTWSNGGTAPQLSNLTAQLYSVTVTDANGCTMADTITVNQDPPPVANISGNNVLCEGENTILTASGGTSYFWNTLQSVSSIVVSPTAATNYSVAVTNGNCSDIASISVSVNPLPTANAGPDVTVAYGSGVQLNGTGGTSYNWFPSSSLSCGNCVNPTASPQSTTDYIVIVTDANGCTDTDTITVVVDLTCKEIFLPNAFSPNGDGENDELQIYTYNLACITDFKIVIFGRLGEKIFQSTNPDFRWDGSFEQPGFNGAEATAVFVYRMTAELISGAHINRRGNITLLR